MTLESQGWIGLWSHLGQLPLHMALPLTQGGCPGHLQRREGLLPSLNLCFLSCRLEPRSTPQPPDSSQVPAGGLDIQGHLRDKAVVPAMFSCRSGREYEPRGGEKRVLKGSEAGRQAFQFS